MPKIAKSQESMDTPDRSIGRHRPASPREHHDPTGQGAGACAGTCARCCRVDARMLFANTRLAISRSTASGRPKVAAVDGIAIPDRAMEEVIPIGECTPIRSPQHPRSRRSRDLVSMDWSRRNPRCNRIYDEAIGLGARKARTPIRRTGRATSPSRPMTFKARANAEPRKLDRSSPLSRTASRFFQHRPPEGRPIISGAVRQHPCAASAMIAGL